MTDGWVDVVAIEQLLYRYAHVLDRGTLDDVMPLFCDDAVLVVDSDGAETRHEGADGVRAWLQTHHYDRAGRIRHLRHKVSTPMIDVAGDTATSVSYLDADGVDTRTDSSRVTTGRYEDRLRRSGDTWRISERRLVFLDRHHYASPRPPRAGG